MGNIIKIPTFTDPDNPTPDETAADTLYKARMQTGRDILSPAIDVRFTATQIPDALFSEAGALLVIETKVMDDADLTVAEVQALAADSNDLLMLVHATLIRRAIGLLPQAAQMLREGILGDSRQFQEIDWELREEKMIGDYQDAIKVVNEDAVFEDAGFGLPTVLTTKTMIPADS